MDDRKPIVIVKDLNYRYDRDWVLKNIQLTVNKGDFLAIVGPNGSGKSTLLKLILGLLKIQQGEILLFGEPLERFRHWEKVGFVSQKANAFNKAFPATVFEVVRSGLTKRNGLFKPYPKTTVKKVIEALKAVQMEEFLYRNIGELSGGQQQRVFIARALIGDPELLILDEPTVGIDTKRVSAFYELMQKLNREKGITLIIVTHDTGIISKKVSHVACLNKHLYFHGNSSEFEQFDQKELSSFYGHEVKILTHDHQEGGME
ncbi:metal ABC transporter ATP-binding protein [Fervidibacillus halotolerans]|uniref:Metal ABC transporter ATP-binding protein n=1 Tax=Fervidibacillus halotolerans TaxID=2980027 RepID=A0A9E8RX86_9BACI|nr:metal ABC transporter ATP-binding protein [Fervidibacillus halotolerans]WAA11476.1 metal ABC transporter ATP-binding protein [Fervidibacillus halotolerans]